MRRTLTRASALCPVIFVTGFLTQTRISVSKKALIVVAFPILYVRASVFDFTIEFHFNASDSAPSYLPIFQRFAHFSLNTVWEKAKHNFSVLSTCNNFRLGVCRSRDLLKKALIKYQFFDASRTFEPSLITV